MKKLNKFLFSLLITTPLLYAEGITIDSIGINLGVSNLPTKQSGTLSLTNKPDESYTNSELYMQVNGLVEDKTIKLSLNYINSTNSEFKNNILMVGANKYYTYENYNIYTGLLIGRGHLEWKYNPLSSTTKSNYTASSTVGAIQLGAEYKLTKNIALGLNTKYFISNYSTKLRVATETSEIKHKTSYSLALGVRYSF